MHSCGFENQGKRKKIPLKRTYVLQALTQAYTANSTSEAGICLCFSALLHLSSVFMSLHIDAVQASSIFLHYVWMWVSSCVGSFECGYF